MTSWQYEDTSVSEPSLEPEGSAEKIEIELIVSHAAQYLTKGPITEGMFKVIRDAVSSS